MLGADQPGEVSLRVPDGANCGITCGDRSPLVDEHAAKLLVVQPFGLLQDRLPVEVRERERSVQLARVDPRHGPPAASQPSDESRNDRPFRPTRYRLARLDLRAGARVLDQVVAERSDVVADEFQDSLAGRDPLFEEIDNP